LPTTFGVVDLFAGPGGLGEGFASFVEAGHAPFSIGISVENEPSAHKTLTLRAFLREFQAQHGALPKQFIDFHAGLKPQPDWEEVDRLAWRKATAEAHCLELGKPSVASFVDASISKLQEEYDENTILIGGPPCQAYSLVGRARSRGKPGYVPEQDARHYLFREYIRVLDKLRPAAFVMENVKGMLSSTIESRLVFEMLLEDLSSLGTGRGHLYELRAIRVENGTVRLQEARQPSDFVVRAEDFGVPQRRHRVIIVGIRSNLAAQAARARINLPASVQTVGDVVGNLPPLRSGLSRGEDSVTAWRRTVVDAARQLARIHSTDGHSIGQVFSKLARRIQAETPPPRASTQLPKAYGKSNNDLLRLLERRELSAIAQHETRGHMPSDLGRYMFAAVFGQRFHRSPKASDFPPALSPDHRNWHSGIFADRFRVQLAREPSTTVTSHISKDGHYFIHPDPAQCRSLTVREAARLQTFPDDYFFLGNRTQQYVQVGNAVPPFLARQIASLLWAALAGNSRNQFRSHHMKPALVST
jgi:DNA (cytosine-5)-methyltransferase 1